MVTGYSILMGTFFRHVYEFSGAFLGLLHTSVLDRLLHFQHIPIERPGLRHCKQCVPEYGTQTVLLPEYAVIVGVSQKLSRQIMSGLEILIT